MTETQYSNRLIYESSPYLLQHAHNPVNWYPWCDEAFTEAKRRQIPLLVSIGYSACHWCHVMERESFEDPEIAGLMNRYFVNIKVDREERPDIDQLYQQAVQMITGQGGWPLTAFLDHDRQPFFGGTYFPPKPMYGRSSFPRILQVIHDKWQQQREDIHEAGSEILNYLQPAADRPGQGRMPEPDLLLKTARELSRAFDERHGGFGTAPKFPNPGLLQLFLKAGTIHNQPPFVGHVLFTLSQMAKGGVYDQLGGGFHRYSTDARWLVPHFEKMLYDNAQLLRLYACGYQLNKSAEYKAVAKETVEYVRREMTAPEGGFYAAQDADSEGEEGRFFVWSTAEIEQLLGAEDAKMLIDYYHPTEEGNFEGKNILNRLDRHELKIEPEIRLQQAKRRLFLAREERVKPFRDEKMITSWNGLMIGALAYVYQVFRWEEAYRLAKQAADCLLSSARLSDGNLARIYKDGQAKIRAMLDDYAFLTQGLIDLYEADFDEVWLQKSLDLAETALKNFTSGDGRYYMAGNFDNLVAQPLSAQDQAIPSGVSVHCENLLRLAAFTGNKGLFHEAEKILATYGGAMQKDGWGYAGLISALDLYYQGFKEFTFISEEPELPEILIKLRQSYIPYRLLVWRNSRKNSLSSHPAREILRGRETVEGKPTCYACFQNSCLAPMTEWEELSSVVANKKIATPIKNI